MSRRSTTPTLPGLDVDLVDRLRRWLADGAETFRALGGGEAAFKACRSRGPTLRKLDIVLEHLEVLIHARDAAKQATRVVEPCRRRDVA
jgi:hypothetical protein